MEPTMMPEDQYEAEAAEMRRIADLRMAAAARARKNEVTEILEILKGDLWNEKDGWVN